MIGKKLFVLVVGMALGLGSPRASFGQEASQTTITRSVNREGSGGNELASTLPYMVLMAVFLGGGIYSFVSRRPTPPRGR